MNETAVGVASAAVSGVLLLIGQTIVARLSKKASDKTVEVQEEANAVSGFKELVDRLETRLDRVEAENRELATRVESLERKRSRDKTLIRYLVEYARKLRTELQTRGVMVPDPPPGLDLDGPLVDG